jgi:hypothetical protein
MQVVEVSGIQNVVGILADMTPREAKNLMRATVADIAKQLAKTAKDYAPVDQGDVKGGIKHKRARGSKNVVAAEVVANTNGTSFHWRFREYGQGPDGREDAMFLTALMKMESEMQRVFLDTFTRKLVDAMARKAKK